MSDRQNIYWIWAAMIQRCTNPNNKAFKRYGARGVSVCLRWRIFENFSADIGQRPPGMSLDRIDNERGYEPGNVRWADRKTQNSNRRNCSYIMDGEERVTLKEFCRRKRLPYRPTVKRIQDYGWSITEALTIPSGHRRRWYEHL